MKSTTMRTAFAASALVLLSNIPATIADQGFQGCYSSSDPLNDQGPYTYQSPGYCSDQCKKGSFAVYALWKGSNCLCGNEMPPEDAKTDPSDCNVSCDGWPSDKCGGDTSYSVYLTGLKGKVPVASSDSSTTTGAGGASATNGQMQTQASQTTFVTDTSQTESSQKKSSSKSNTAAIAAGVVVGTVGFFALVGAIFFVWRLKKRRSVESQFRQDAAGNNFNKPMSTNSMSDSRFDGDFMAQRRQSNGSIDDDQDFSRRILQVTNPDNRR